MASTSCRFGELVDWQQTDGVFSRFSLTTRRAEERQLVGKTGVGKDNPLKDSRVRGSTLSAVERADLLEFLDSLTNAEFLTDPAFSDPWK